GVRVHVIENDCPHPGRFAGRHRNTDFLLRAFFRCGDSAFLTQATSIAPSGSKSCRAHEVHTAIPRQSASSSERPVARRRISKRPASGVVSFLLMAGPAGWTHSAMAGWNCDLWRRSAALRFDSKAPGAFGALQTLGHRRPDVANSNATP